MIAAVAEAEPHRPRSDRSRSSWRRALAVRELTEQALRAEGVDPAEYGPLSFVGTLQPVTRTRLDPGDGPAPDDAPRPRRPADRARPCPRGAEPARRTLDAPDPDARGPGDLRPRAAGLPRVLAQIDAELAGGLDEHEKAVRRVRVAPAGTERRLSVRSCLMAKTEGARPTPGSRSSPSTTRTTRRASSSRRASTRSRAGPTRTCTAAGRGRSGSTRASPRPRRRTSASATCSTAARPGSRSPSTCRRSSATTPTTSARVGEVGRTGVAIDSIADMELLFDGDPARPGLDLDDDQRAGRAAAAALRAGGGGAGRAPATSCAARSRTTSSRSTSRAGTTSSRRGRRCG